MCKEHYCAGMMTCACADKTCIEIDLNILIKKDIKCFLWSTSYTITDWCVFLRYFFFMMSF